MSIDTIEIMLRLIYTEVKQVSDTLYSVCENGRCSLFDAESNEIISNSRCDIIEQAQRADLYILMMTDKRNGFKWTNSLYSIKQKKMYKTPDCLENYTVDGFTILMHKMMTFDMCYIFRDDTGELVETIKCDSIGVSTMPNSMLTFNGKHNSRYKGLHYIMNDYTIMGYSEAMKFNEKQALK